MSESDNSFNESMDHPLADHPLINIENLSEPGTASLPLNNDINAVDNVTGQGDPVGEETVNDNNNVVPSKNNRSKEIACIETPSKKIKLHCNPIHEEFNFSDGYSVCIHCKTKLKGKNTSTLITHVQKKHLGVYKAFLKKKANKVKEQENRKLELAVVKDSHSVNQLNNLSASILGTPSVASFFSRKYSEEQYSYNDGRQKKVTRALALLLATTTIPVDIVLSPQFNNLVRTLDPHARVPGAKYMRKEINSTWNEVLNVIKKSLNNTRHVALTADIWTSKNLNASYLGVTVHFFDFEKKSRRTFKIACREFPNPHTGKMIAEKIMVIANEYGLSDRIGFIGCDNGANMVKSFSFMHSDEDNDEQNLTEVDAFDTVLDSEDEGDLESLSQSDIGFDFVENISVDIASQEAGVRRDLEEYSSRDSEVNDVIHDYGKIRLPCYAHTCQIAINRVNKTRNQAFGRVLTKTKHFVSKYRKSSKAKYVLSKTSYKKRLPGWVQTRWHSELDMSKAIVEASELEDKPLAKLTEEMNWNMEMSVADIRCLKQYNQIMEPFANKTNLLGGEKYSTIQLVLPTLLEMSSHLTEVARSATGSVHSYCEAFKLELNTVFKHVLEPHSSNFISIYHAATFLDPVFSQILSSDQMKIAIDDIKNRIKILMLRKGEDWENVIENVGEGDRDTVKKTQLRGFKYMSSLIDNAQSTQKSKSTPFSRDIDLYKAEITRISVEKTMEVSGQEDVLFINDNLVEEVVEERPVDDPLQYWVENEGKYETYLPLIAQDILCVPATSTPSERLFSASGLLSSGVMANINPSNLEKRVLVKVNLKT